MGKYIPISKVTAEFFSDFESKYECTQLNSVLLHALQSCCNYCLERTVSC